MDWEAWARRVERAIDVAGRGDWAGLFASGATFADPATTTPTEDLRSISRQTKRIFDFCPPGGPTGCQKKPAATHQNPSMR